MGNPSQDVQESKLNPALEGPSQDLITGLMQAAGIDPRKTDYTGPRMAAMNPAQMQAMDMAAAQGNSLGFDMTGASNYLPASTEMQGMQAYDTRAMANQGVSPALEQLYRNLWGAGGVMGQHAQQGGAGGRQTAPAATGGGSPMLMNLVGMTPQEQAEYGR